MSIETKLKQLFDYQKFENNPRLERIIEQSAAEELSEDILLLVNAAGDPEMSMRKFAKRAGFFDKNTD